MSDGHHRSSMALVIVLFVLLIVIGTSFMSGY
ncbi:YjcZ family sporulation protein [Neobacillus drentensis]|nr:YjcZ family sporulation protein [Neobacillus drentensis]